ncbi:MAG: histidine kinase [Chitinophagaceae bacterium]|jgi:sensor histidine kinase YesM|nr:histidine kinase [Chitinophagaceae bacterium]
MASRIPGFLRQASRFQGIIALWIGWTALYAWASHSLGFPIRLAITDSILANLHLAGACLLMLTILRYYMPGRSQYINLLALVSGLTLIWYVAFRLSWLALVPHPEPVTFWEEIFPLRMAIALLVIFCFTLYSVLNHIQEEKEIQVKRKSDAEKLARDAELYRLQQQLQPHFLFNSLNSISALAGRQPEQARLMIQQLSEFLRGTLRRKEEEMVPLAEELHQLDLYLSIEKIRFGHRLLADIHTDPACAGTLLPPLILQPLVENAIKFGLYDTTGEVSIRLEARCADNQLTITVSNPFDPETSPNTRGAGFGLASVQRRLFLIFGRNDLLETGTQNSRFITTLHIPQS